MSPSVLSILTGATAVFTPSLLRILLMASMDPFLSQCNISLSTLQRDPIQVFAQDFKKGEQKSISCKVIHSGSKQRPMCTARQPAQPHYKVDF